MADKILREIQQRLNFLAEVGLPYLTLDRRADTLSGGEAQRIRLAAQLGSNLRGVCYILDEPTIGLHPRDNAMLLSTLRRLEQLGNSVLVVEHDEATIQSADLIVDLGPGAGVHGGSVVSIGTPEEIKNYPDSPTGAYLRSAKQTARSQARLSGNPLAHDPRRQSAQFKKLRRQDSPRHVDLRHRHLRLGQEHAGQGSPLQRTQTSSRPIRRPARRA